MSRFVFRSALVLSLLLALPILLVRPQPHDDANLTAFLIPPVDCPAPCFMGLRPGYTGVEDALAHLQAHDWVAMASLETYRPDNAVGDGYYWITFTWSDSRPEAIDPVQPGRVDFRKRSGRIVVDSIVVRTRFQMPHVQDWFGQASGDGHSLFPDRSLSYGSVYRSTDLAVMVGANTVLRCPVTLLDYWYSRTEIQFTTWVGVGLTRVPLQEVIETC